MKKHFALTVGVIGLGLIAQSSDSFASRARNAVMFGGDGGSMLTNGHGSFYYDDAYNMFYNPSYVNDFKNWGIIEKFNGVSGAEGGFVANVMNVNVGLFFNRLDSVTGLYSTPSVMKPIELFVGADTVVKWGLSVGYARQSSNQHDLTARLGAQYMDFEPFFAIKPLGKDTTSGVEFKNSDIMGGLRYKFGEWVPYFAIRSLNAKVAGVDNKTTTWGLALGRNTKLTDGVRLNYTVGYWSTKVGTADADGFFPVEMGVEGDALSWLTVRGGFAYRKASSARLGASLHFGKVDFDWALGNSDGTESLDSVSNGLAHGFFTTASVGYRW